MKSSRPSAARPFGQKRSASTITISRGGRQRQFELRMMGPAGLAMLGCLLGTAYLGATAYLVLRDDLVAGAQARQARVEQAYEDRISALRAQVDRIASRQMLDQQLVENRVSELIERQNILALRSQRIAPLLDSFGVTTGSVPMPKKRPDQRADASRGPGTLLASLLSRPDAGLGTDGGSAADRADEAFVAINHSLRDVESLQIDQLAAVAGRAETATDRLSKALAAAGVASPVPAMGGPLEDIGPGVEAPDAADRFESVVNRLDTALGRFETARRSVSGVPLANPLPGQPLSSGFGVRNDPLLGRRAMHSGLDFVGPVGTPIRATADGTVTHAGRKGGYGLMVEVRHASGYVTRYAHMSRIGVTVGQSVHRGEIVGRLGSTGRSTGPHLHYEVRRDGTAQNPSQVLGIGRKIADLL